MIEAKDLVSISYTFISVSICFYCLQVHPVPLPTSLPTAAKDLTVEPEPPVDKKAITKAFTPPVTLRNFFKPKNVTTKELKQEPHTSGADVVECPTSRQEDVEGKEIVSVASSSKPRDTQMKLTDSFAKAPPCTSRDAPILIEEASGAAQRPTEKVRLGKRKSEECVPIVKALKRRMVVHCPVCSKEFTDVSNFDLNQHLDSCLRAQLPLNSPQTTN